ncbi:hypothetical protein KC727_02930 [Candidatus Kaiserbacteria bacterium]|nr:hypothetical protein [Candidatus Kaiserbacteria bacterium]
MRIIVFILVCGSALMSGPIFAGICMVAYALWKPAYELIILGFCIDAFFGTSTFVHQYLLLTAAIVLVAELLKPQLRFYHA